MVARVKRTQERTHGKVFKGSDMGLVQVWDVSEAGAVGGGTVRLYGRLRVGALVLKVIRNHGRQDI